MSPKEELEKAQVVLEDLERLAMSQNLPYQIHLERLGGLKYLYNRLVELKRLEELVAERNEPVVRAAN